MRKRLIYLFAVFLAFTFVFVATSSAFAEGMQDGNRVSIEVKTDKEQYKKGEVVHYSIKLLNESPFAAKEIVLKTDIPEGLEITKTDGKLEGQELTWKIDSISGLGEAEVSFTGKLTAEGTTPPVVNPGVGDGTNNPPQTGDDTNILFYVLLLILSVTIMTIAIIVYKRTKFAKEITFLLIIGFVASASFLTVANAEEKDTSNQTKHQITIDGKSYETVFTIDSVVFDQPTLSLENNLPDGFDEKDYFSLDEPTLVENYLAWTAIKEADSYIVKKRTSSGDYEVVAKDIKEASYIDSNLEADQTYYYKIEAIYNDKVVVGSNEVIQPAAPRVTADMDENQLRLSWNAVEGAKTYEVYRGEIEINTTVTSEDYEDTLVYGDYELVASVEQPSFEESLESDGKLYYYFVKAVSGEHTSHSSNVFVMDTAVIDSDMDELTDNVEKEIVGSDPTNPDTNGNGIPDGYEYTVLESDPSDLESGVAQEDFDDDGLDNLQEYQKGTDPWKADSDEDGLSDIEELESYGTDPINEDTDGDFLLDGSEEKLGFDPLKADTNGNGVIDSKENILQEVESDNLSEVNTEDNTALPSISIFGQGDINQTVVVRDESTNPLLRDLIYVEGTPIDISTDNEFEYANLSFELDEDLNLEEHVITYLDGDGNIHLLDTEVDNETHSISTTVDHFSIYFVSHLPTLYHSWGITGSDDEDLTSPIVERGAADISFVIDSTGSMGGAISNVRRNIINFVEQLNTSDVDVRLGLVDYKDIYADGPDSTINHGWFTNPSDYQNKISSLSVTGGGDTPESSADALEEARRMGFRENVNKYIILVTDADNKNGTRFDGVDTMDDVIEELEADGITVIVISATYLETHYENLFTSTGGIFIDIYSDFASTLTGVVDLVSEEVTDGVWIRLSNGTIAKLDKEPDATDMVTDTDEDGLPDSQELTFPAREVDIIRVGGEPVVVGVYDYNSYPHKADTDNDTYGDKDDLEPLKPYKKPVVLIHGLTDNSNSLYGAETALSSSNLHFIIENVNSYSSIDRSSSNSLNGRNYYDPASHQIINLAKGNGSEKAPERLGYQLKQAGYEKNKNLFVLNYPALDFNWKNADILKWYIEEHLRETKEVYPTESAYNSRSLKVDLVGHSNGGLVSRYYIENLSGSRYVDKLITMNTPHWGSGLATASSSIPTWGSLETGPLHMDLEPSGLFYGGDRTIMFFFNQEKQRYINSYQSPELRFNNNGGTEYDFIAAYDDFAPYLLPGDMKDRTYIFGVNPATNSFSDFRQSIANGFFNKYPEYESSVVFTFSDSGGDNVVNNQSQLGVTYKDFGNGKAINANSYTMMIDTFTGHNAKNNLHGEIPKRAETIDQVLEYLR